MRNRLAAISAATMLLLALTANATESAAAAAGTTEAAFGKPNPKGPKELSQYDFLAGDWVADVTLVQQNGVPFKYVASWHNHWTADGYVMVQEWIGPYAMGIELRTFNMTTKKWDGRNIYEPSPGVWYENTAELIGDEMIVTTQKKTAEGEPFLSREIYFDISSESFSIRSEISYDGGKEWRPGKYSLVATRS